jgi:hypothetical protein
MADAAQAKIVHNLIEALEQLRRDLDKVELWAGALGCFQGPAPAYKPGDQYVLPPSSRAPSCRAASSEPAQGAPPQPPS